MNQWGISFLFLLPPLADGTQKPAAETMVAVPPKMDFSRCPLPTYPEWSRRREEEGRVVVEALISESGRVLETALAEPTKHILLNRAAEKAVRGWTFHPARKNGKPVRERIQIPFQFQLERANSRSR